MYEMKYAQKWKSKLSLLNFLQQSKQLLKPVLHFLGNAKNPMSPPYILQAWRAALQGLDRKKKQQTAVPAEVKDFANVSNKARTLQVGLASSEIHLFCEGSLSTS